MTTIGNFYLIDRGAFNVKPEVNYVNPDGTKGTTSAYGTLMAGQSLSFDIGDNSDVQNGATVTLKCDVVAGFDRTAGESYVYQKGTALTANYSISGVTINPHLKFLGTTANVAEPA